MIHPHKVTISWRDGDSTGQTVLSGADSFVWRDENTGEWETYWWDFGNGFCDCNRSLLLLGKNWDEVRCGSRIEITKIEITEEAD